MTVYLLNMCLAPSETKSDEECRLAIDKLNKLLETPATDGHIGWDDDKLTEAFRSISVMQGYTDKAITIKKKQKQLEETVKKMKEDAGKKEREFRELVRQSEARTSAQFRDVDSRATETEKAVIGVS